MGDAEPRDAPAVDGVGAQAENDVGLFTEEIDPALGEQRGNLPQAFTHMGIINHAIRIDEARERA